MPHESPLHSAHPHGSDEGSMQHDLTVLVTNLTNRIGTLETDLQQTKKAYSTAFTKLVLRVKKLETQIKLRKARRKARIVLTDDEDDVKDSSKQGRKIAHINEDPTISLVQDKEETPTELVEDLGSAEKGEMETSTANILVSTASPPKDSTADISTVSLTVSTAAAALIYIRRSGSKRKDKRKAIMTEPEPPKKKLKKREQVQISMDKELARKILEEEQARAAAVQEQERLNLEAALEIQR
ncbi:hypothetical protein Tco_1234467 [Tanacetum coccineum]